MLCDLPFDLQDVVLEFAYDANLVETRAALDTICEIRDTVGSSYFVKPCTRDYTLMHETFYSRRVHKSVPGARFLAEHAMTPLSSFYVWWDMEDLFDFDRISQAIEDIDWRKAKKLLPLHMRHLPARTIQQDILGSCKSALWFTCFVRRIGYSDLRICKFCNWYHVRTGYNPYIAWYTGAEGQ